MFNTLKYAKILEEVGFSREQAETSIKILVEIMEDKLANKQDLQELENRIDSKFQLLQSKVSLDLSALNHSIAQTKSDLTIRMGTMLATSIAILTAIQKLV